ncbi:MAG: zinc-ribbon domain-containing protein, partial [Burkholderiales bacterium]
MLCAACNATIADGVRFCTACGAPVAARCPHCHAEVSASDKFCGACGGGLDAAAASAPARGSAEGERRQVTVLFADMEGYTTLAEKLGEEGTYTLMQPVLARMVETIHANGGTTQDLAGDGVMALFGAPQAL